MIRFDLAMAYFGNIFLALSVMDFVEKSLGKSGGTFFAAVACYTVSVVLANQYDAEIQIRKDGE